MQSPHALLVALLLRMLTLAGYGHVHDARPIVEATVDVVEDDAAATLEGDASRRPVLTSYVEDAALQVYWAVRESSLDLRASGDGGRSVGAWQLQAAAGRGNAWVQARAWRALLRTGRERCPRSPAAIMWGDCEVPTQEGPSSRTLANRRAARARSLLLVALGASDGEREGQTFAPSRTE
jgi:hypothetical protein